MKYIENIVIGNPILPPCVMFASDVHDWINNEIEKTYYTNERFLQHIRAKSPTPLGVGWIAKKYLNKCVCNYLFYTHFLI